MKYIRIHHTPVTPLIRTMRDAKYSYIGTVFWLMLKIKIYNRILCSDFEQRKKIQQQLFVGNTYEDKRIVNRTEQKRKELKNRAESSADFVRTQSLNAHMYCLCSGWLRDVIKIFWRCYLLKDLRISMCMYLQNRIAWANESARLIQIGQYIRRLLQKLYSKTCQ